MKKLFSILTLSGLSTLLFAQTPLPISKGYFRLSDFPLDSSSVYTNYDQMMNYVTNSSTVYAGQIISLTSPTSTVVYVISKDLDGYQLSSIASGNVGGETTISYGTDSTNSYRGDWGANLSNTVNTVYNWGNHSTNGYVTNLVLTGTNSVGDIIKTNTSQELIDESNLIIEKNKNDAALAVDPLVAEKYVIFYTQYVDAITKATIAGADVPEKISYEILNQMLDTLCDDPTKKDLQDWTRIAVRLGNAWNALVVADGGNSSITYDKLPILERRRLMDEV